MKRMSNSLGASLALVPRPGEKREGTFARLDISEDQTSANLEIWDFIGDEWYGTTAKEFISQIKDLPKTITSINVLISSPGGWVWDAIEMYQALKNHPAHVTTEVNAIAASAATIIFMAGDTRNVGPYADFMIHKPWGWSSGDANKFREIADRLDRDQEKLVSIYIENGCKEDKEKVNEMINAETWLTGQEVVDKGFATDLVDDLQAAACLFDVNLLPGCPDHHKRLSAAWEKRKKEHASRDGGMSRRQAKTAAATPVRDVPAHAFAKALRAHLKKMEK